MAGWSKICGFDGKSASGGKDRSRSLTCGLLANGLKSGAGCEQPWQGLAGKENSLPLGRSSHGQVFFAAAAAELIGVDIR